MAKAKTKAPLETLAETTYLRQLAKSKVPIGVKMHNGRVISGTLEIFDAHVLRVTRPAEASIQISKDEIKYLWEEAPTQA